MYETAHGRYADLHKMFPHRFSTRTWSSMNAFDTWLSRRSAFDTTSKNTTESLHVAYRMIRDVAKSERALVYFVSSANHLPRVMRDACDVLGVGSPNDPVRQRLTLLGVPSETCYGNLSVRATMVRDRGM